MAMVCLYNFNPRTVNLLKSINFLKNLGLLKKMLNKIDFIYYYKIIILKYYWAIYGFDLLVQLSYR